VFATPPVSEKELMERADALVGKTLQQIANETESTVPVRLKNAKGWIGELIEISLGATAASRPEPDFQLIGVELKTIPIEASSDIPLALRRIGSAVLWSPDVNQESQLRADWEELMEIVCLGELERLTSLIGVYLQIRPKAANARSLSTGLSKSGDIIQTLPRGFYLRSSFTAEILSQ
jgi:DNA mismatch repair protein MutH